MKRLEKSKRTGRRQMFHEPLEERRMLAVVTSNGDTGSAGELRTELAAAAPGETIEFNLAAGSETINLTLGELTIDKDVTVDGLNSAGSGVQVTIDAGGNSRVMYIDDGSDVSQSDVTLQNLTITGGDTSTTVGNQDGAGIFNLENLTINDSLITGNFAADDGGGIFSDGSLTIARSDIDNNSAEDRAGGLFAYGTVNISDSSISSNSIDTTTGDALGVGALLGAGSNSTIDATKINDNFGNTTYVDPVNMVEAAGRGTGIYVSGFGDAVPTSLTITNSELQGNTTDGMGAAIQAGIAVSLTIEDSMILNNTAAGDGGGIGTSSFGVDSNAVTTIRRTTLSGNLAGDDGGAIEPAGGVTVIIEDSIISNNHADSRGGGIYARGQDAVLDTIVTISGSTFEGNSTDDDGGGVHAGSSVQITIDDSLFTGNTSASRGAAIRLSFADEPDEESTAVIRNTMIFGNSSTDDAGGIYIGQLFDTLMENVTVTENMAGDGGGGIRIQAFGPLTIVDSTISNNTSGGFGAGFHNISGSSVTAERVTVANNSAGGGGGAMDTTGSAVTFLNSTISGNTAASVGGGLYLELDPTDPIMYTHSLRGTTVFNNSSGGYGGGIYIGYYSSPSIAGSVISGNSAALAPDIYRDYGAFDISYSLVGDSSGSILTESPLDPNGNIIGGPVGGAVNAMLGALADNGGPTLTHLPLAGSPVIDAGDPAVTDGTDQRGFARVWDSVTNMPGGRVDMGSVEFLSQPTISVDFNGDGEADCEDIDALQAEIVAGTNNASFDLNGDSLVNVADRNLWLLDAAVFNGFTTAYQSADFNLDRVVDVSDFGIWNGSKFTNNSAFCSGDATADGVVDVSDFGVWNGQKFTSADAAAATRVTPNKSLLGAAERRLRKSQELDEEADANVDFGLAGDRDVLRHAAANDAAAPALYISEELPDPRQATAAALQLAESGFQANLQPFVATNDIEDATDIRIRSRVIDAVFASNEAEMDEYVP